MGNFILPYFFFTFLIFRSEGGPTTLCSQSPDSSFWRFFASSTRSLLFCLSSRVISCAMLILFSTPFADLSLPVFIRIFVSFFTDLNTNFTGRGDFCFATKSDYRLWFFYIFYFQVVLL